MAEWLSGDYRRYNNKTYLGHWDLPDDEDLIVTIAGVKFEDVRNASGTTEKQKVMYFEEDVKPLILNKKKNPGSITKALGTPKMEMWRGRRIALYVGEERTSEDGLAVRIRDYPPKETKAYCDNCGSLIEPHGSYSVNKIVTMSKAKYGQALCWDCASARKEADK